MLIINQNTEEKLYQKLQLCWQQPQGDRCMQLKLSRFSDVLPREKMKEIYSAIFAEFRALLDDQSFEFYICHDSDLFVVTRSLTQKRVDQILSHLAPKLAPAQVSPGLASLFEIGVDWPKLRQICKKKTEAIRIKDELEQKTVHPDVPKISRSVALGSIDQDLLASLPLRRLKRDTEHIMVVEDDLFSQKMVSASLKNYSLSMSADGAGALMSYVRHAPDVLFLDIGLPDINGHEVLEKLFEIDPDAYVVMFSGNGDRENVLRAVELGAKGFVGKPFTREKLIAYIEKSPFIQQKHNKENMNGLSAS